MSNYVLVIDTNKRPLDPQHPSTARKLLDDQKAAVFRKYPFTIIMKDAFPDVEVNPVELKLDPGSKTTGIALVVGDKVIFGAEVNYLQCPPGQCRLAKYLASLGLRYAC